MNADGSFFGTLDDVGKTAFKDTTSKESLQNIAVSAAAAGIAQGATQVITTKPIENFTLKPLQGVK